MLQGLVLLFHLARIAARLLPPLFCAKIGKFCIFSLFALCSIKNRCEIIGLLFSQNTFTLIISKERIRTNTPLQIKSFLGKSCFGSVRCTDRRPKVSPIPGARLSPGGPVWLPLLRPCWSANLQIFPKYHLKTYQKPIIFFILCRFIADSLLNHC